ncbi:7087_t:CDS:2, partial [Rhizophagus irregularis]
KRSAYAQHILVCPKNNVNPIDNKSDSETSINAIQDVNQNNEGDISHDEMEYESYQDASFNSVQSTFSVMSYEDILECEESEKPEQSVKEPEKSGESAEESEESGKSAKGSEESAEESAEESEESEESAKVFENSEESEESAREKELESSKKSEETYTEFPNEVYKDLMILVTKHKLNNKASNAIINFFNKYSTLSKSPLPKNIEKGRVFMNKMKFSNLTFKRILITTYNNKEYFLHYQDLLNCIKNILEIPDIMQDFALSFEDCKVIIFF